MGHKACRLVGLSDHGFTLAEVLVVMALSGVVLGAIYGVFTSSDRSYRTQDRVANAQQSVRVGIRFMVEDIRMAGLDPSGTAGAGIEDAQSNRVRVTADLDMDGAIDDAKRERVTYEYDPQNHPNVLRQCLYEGTGSQSWQTLIDNVSALSFTYLDANGNDLGDPVAAADLSKIRTVGISMTVQEKDPRLQRLQPLTITRTLNARVTCRNLGL
jgi:type IV pilus assembly protein PilW